MMINSIVGINTIPKYEMQPQKDNKQQSEVQNNDIIKKLG